MPKTIRLAFACAALLGGTGGAAFAQGGNKPELTPAEQAADEVLKKLGAAMKERVVGEDDPLPIANHPYHIVFLFDSAQVKDTPIYRDFATDVVRRVLERFFQNQTLKKAPDADRCLVSVYPYQLDLYAGAEHLGPVPLAAGTSERAAKALPMRTLTVRGDGKTPYRLAQGGKNSDGHDNTTPRRDLFRLLKRGVPGDPGMARPPLVIQMTPNQDNAAPLIPDLSAQIGKRDPQTWGVAEEKFALLAVVNGKTRSGLPGHPPIPVRIWAYAPAEIVPGINWKSADAPAAPPNAIRPGGDTGRRAGSGSNAGAVLGGLVALAAVAGAVYYGTMSSLVAIGAYRKRIRRFQSIKIVAAGGKAAGSDAYELPNVPGASAGQTLATIEYGLLDLKVRGAAWQPNKTGQSKDDGVVLARGNNDVFLTSGNEKSPTMRIVVS